VCDKAVRLYLFLYRIISYLTLDHMNRLQEFEAAVKKVTFDNIKANMPEPKMLHAEMNWNMESLGYTFDVTNHMVPSGLEKVFISRFGMKICKKSEALYLLVVGEKQDGMFMAKKYKNYWLKAS
jgi:hypothetical protein